MSGWNIASGVFLSLGGRSAVVSLTVTVTVSLSDTVEVADDDERYGVTLTHWQCRSTRPPPPK